MRKLQIVFMLIFLSDLTDANGQCTGMNFYDLTVTGNTILPPAATAYISAVVCDGGVLIDSASCCTRVTHILNGGIYEIGGLAYGSVFVQSGGTFNANNTSMFFGVTYEAGANILNYSGPLTLCSSISFLPSACVTGLNSISSGKFISVFYDHQGQFLKLNGIQNNSFIQVFDMTGRLILEPKLLDRDGSNEIYASLFPGLYSYRITDKRGHDVQGKFAVSR